jgi:hypothetical protein
MAFGLATAIAAYDSGAFEPWERRIVVIACTTAMPEATTPMQEIAGIRDLMSRFIVHPLFTFIGPSRHPARVRSRHQKAHGRAL